MPKKTIKQQLSDILRALPLDKAQRVIMRRGVRLMTNKEASSLVKEFKEQIRDLKNNAKKDNKENQSSKT